MRYKHGRMLSDEEVGDLRQRRRNGEPCESIASDYGIASVTVSAIALGRNYKRLNDKYPPVTSVYLKTEDVREIRYLVRSKGYSTASIATEFNISQSRAANIAYGKTYKHLNKKYKPACPRKFSETDVKDIRKRRHLGESCQSIADDYESNVSMIHSIGGGVSYAHLNHLYPPVKIENRTTKISKETKKNIRRLWSMPSRKMTLEQIAQRFDVSTPYVYRIAVGER